MPVRLGLALLVVLAACDDEQRKDDLELAFSFAPANGVCAEIVGAPSCTNIDNCPLDCTTEVVVRLLDSDTGATIRRSCRRFAELDGRRLRALPDLVSQIFEAVTLAPGRKVRVEVAAFSPPGPVECPEANFNVDPPVTPTGVVPAYYARTGVLTIGDSKTAALPLACGPLRTQCSAPTMTVETSVLELGPLVEAKNQDTLQVILGQVKIDSPGASFTVLSSPQMMWNHDLVNSRWTLEIPLIDEKTRLATLVGRLGAPLDVLSCDTTLSGGQAVTSAIELDRTTYTTILNNLGLSNTGLPPQGLFIGRVVNNVGTSNQPIEGASVRPLKGTAEVIYLDDALQPTSALVTSSQAWVVIRERPAFPFDPGTGQPTANTSCCELFEVRKGEQVGCSQGPIGLVDDFVTAGTFDIGSPCPGSLPD
jgi:hypothetical protein